MSTVIGHTVLTLLIVVFELDDSQKTALLYLLYPSKASWQFESISSAF